ncbi:hypothetical protein OROMI_027015 [Orobanche minor]
MDDWELSSEELDSLERDALKQLAERNQSCVAATTSHSSSNKSLTVSSLPAHVPSSRSPAKPTFLSRPHLNNDEINTSWQARIVPSSMVPKMIDNLSKSQQAKVTVKFFLHATGNIAAKFPYDKLLIGAFHDIPRASWNAKERLWMFPLSSLSTAESVLCDLPGSNIEIENLDPLVRRAIAAAAALPDLQDTDKYDKIPSYIESKLLSFQREGIRFILQHGVRVLLADEMGLGKTLQAIAVTSCIREAWPVLILAPSSLRLHWASTIQQWLNIAPSDILVVLSQWNGSNRGGFNVVSSNAKKPINLDGVFNIISYDIVPKLQDRILASDFKVVIADESHFLKNGQAKRTNSSLPILQHLQKAQYTILLSGTPALSRPIELFKQLEALYPDVYKNVHEYGNRYCKGGIFGFYQGASNHEELHNLMKATLMIRRLKKDVLSELPVKRRQQVFLELGEREMRQINALFLELETVKRKIKSCQSKDEAESLKFTEKNLINKIYTDSAEVKIPAVLDYLGTITEMADSTSTEARDLSKDPTRKAKSSDPGWKYGFWPDLNNKDIVQCSLCNKQVHAGIRRLKQHLAGGYGDVQMCAKTTTSIIKEMQDYIRKNARKTVVPLDDDNDDDVDEVEPNDISTAASNTVPSSGTSAKRKKASYFVVPQSKPTKSIASTLRKTPEEVVEERHCRGPYQTSIENSTKTAEEKERVNMHIANFFYENGIPFNAAHSRSYEIMIESIGQFGPGLKPPTYHDLRVPLLEKAKKETDKLRERHEKAWKQYGCTLMSDGFSDRKGRHLINFLVNSPEGTFFLGIVDASSRVQDARMLASLLDEQIDLIGREHVIQVITDNGSNFKAAGGLLCIQNPTLYWTPCAAHCIDLMLEDIAKLKEFHISITHGKGITTFVYRHGRLLSAMREKTDGRDLVRAEKTKNPLDCTFEFESCKFLIFAHHQPMIDAIHKFLLKKNVECIRIDGSTPAASRQALVTEFQEKDSVRAAVLSIKAGGIGLTLTAASTVIFAELSWTPGDIIQAEDRAHRIGQVSSVNIYYLLANDTVDDIIWDVIQNKLENLGQMLDGQENSLQVSVNRPEYSPLKASGNQIGSSPLKASGNQPGNSPMKQTKLDFFLKRCNNSGSDNEHRHKHPRT